jgi:hypothetical protein
MPIKNLSEARRLPRLGKIHLGVKKVSEKSGKEYPTETSYFVVPAEVEAVFGKNPTQLRVMFPIENDEVFFPQWYKCYGTNLLKCKGDGEKAFTWDEENGGMKEIPCPCPKLEGGDCKQIGILQFLLPEVPGAGTWQITTSSKNSIIDINSSIAFIRGICGRIRMIPLILKREEMVMQRTENGQPKKSTHYTLKLDLDEKLTLRQLQQAAQVKPEMVLLPPPDETKDELLYPKNGFKADDSADDDEADAADEKEILSERIGTLDKLLIELHDLGYKHGKKQADWVESLKTVEEFDKAIKFFEEKKREFSSKVQ